jgi:PAS domain S-box-containing protein
VDSLQQQISTAVSKLNVLQRRADAYSPEPPKILRQMLHELASVIEQLQGAQEQLVESRGQLDAAREELQRERDRYWQLFDTAPEAYLVTGPQSQILEANRAAAELLNISQRFLIGKVLSVFVCDNRQRFLTQAASLAQVGGSADWMLRFRPRERAPIEVAARVVSSGADGEKTLRWMVRPVREQFVDQAPIDLQELTDL